MNIHKIKKIIFLGLLTISSLHCFSQTLNFINYKEYSTPSVASKIINYDFNSDNITDVAFIAGRTFGILYGNGIGQLVDRIDFNTQYSALDLEVKDINKDNIADIVIFSSNSINSINSYYIEVYLGKGTNGYDLVTPVLIPGYDVQGITILWREDL